MNAESKPKPKENSNIEVKRLVLNWPRATLFILIIVLMSQTFQVNIDS